MKSNIWNFNEFEQRKKKGNMLDLFLIYASQVKNKNRKRKRRKETREPESTEINLMLSSFDQIDVDFSTKF